MTTKENKYSTLLKASLAILIISVALLCFSAYNFYRDKKEEPKVDPAAVLKAERDSLKAEYEATIKKLEENFGDPKKITDTASADLDVKVTEFNRLHNEIIELLKKQGPATDITVDKEKLIELQQKVDALSNKNSDVELENQRLQALLDQLKANAKAQTTPVAVKQPAGTNTIAADKPAKPIIASTLQLVALTTANNAEQKTNASDQAQKFVGSFVIKNVADKKNTDLMVIVLQPDGKVVRNSASESGSFETDEGRKVYSRKLSFNPGENEKQLNFSLSPERFFKGEYTMQIWYNGNLIGMLKRALS
jgi:hypothetical protein